MSRIRFIKFYLGPIADQYSDASLFNNGWLTLNVDTAQGKIQSDRKPPEVFEGIATRTITKGRSRFIFEIIPKRANIEIEWVLQEWVETEQNGNNSLLTCHDYCWPDYNRTFASDGIYTERKGIIALVEAQGTAIQSRSGLFYPDGIVIRFEEEKSKDY